MVHIIAKEALSCSVDRQTVLDHVDSTGDIHGELERILTIMHEYVIRIRPEKEHDLHMSQNNNKVGILSIFILNFSHINKPVSGVSQQNKEPWVLVDMSHSVRRQKLCLCQTLVVWVKYPTSEIPEIHGRPVT